MDKKEQEEILTEIGGYKAKIILGNPADKLAEKKRIDKLNAMKIAMSYIEIQGLKCDEKKTTAIADEFLEWLKK